MTNPMYPSLIPRYVDESWFASDQPVDEAAKLNELEANNEIWIREAQYRNTEVHTTHVDTVEDGEPHDDEEDEEMNDDEDEDDEDLEEGDDIDEESFSQVNEMARIASE